jgi:hypothetical protein
MKKPDPFIVEAKNSSDEDQTIGGLLNRIRELVRTARKAAVTTINSLQVITNFEIGRMIVEHEQQGAQRAAYGQEILRDLSNRLTEEFGKGFPAPIWNTYGNSTLPTGNGYPENPRWHLANWLEGRNPRCHLGNPGTHHVCKGVLPMRGHLFN